MPLLQCVTCLDTKDVPDSAATAWQCACGRSYAFRRCSACHAVTQVSMLQRRDQPWECQWCRAPNTGFSRLNDPDAATVADFIADMTRHGRGYLPKPHRQEPVRMLIVTTNEIPGYRITSVQGDVFGLIVRARNYFSNLGASFRTLVGGEVAGYTTLLTDSRNQARERMWREARAQGANAVVAMRFDCNEIGDIMSEVAAYGTAVTVEPISATDIRE